MVHYKLWYSLLQDIVKAKNLQGFKNLYKLVEENIDEYYYISIYWLSLRQFTSHKLLRMERIFWGITATLLSCFIMLPNMFSWLLLQRAYWCRQAFGMIQFFHFLHPSKVTWVLDHNLFFEVTVAAALIESAWKKIYLCSPSVCVFAFTTLDQS